MYSVHQHWDPLKVCLVGRSYPAEFYSFIQNPKVRTVMETIANETEEDYQKLIELLHQFGVTTLRPDLTDSIEDYRGTLRYEPPPMTPRDYTAMIGNTFYITKNSKRIDHKWDEWRGSNWPLKPPSNKAEFDLLPESLKNEIFSYAKEFYFENTSWDGVVEHIKQQGNSIEFNTGINTAMTTRVGRDLYFGTEGVEFNYEIANAQKSKFPNYRTHVIDTKGHADGTYCPVKPGLIVSLEEIPKYSDTFPDWEVVYLPGQSWGMVDPFLKLKNKNAGKWWVPGQELNDQFTYFVESWLSNWVGFVEETVFDVNMLVIDEKNVVCNNYNKKVFDAFGRHGITPHIVNFRHRYFWDGGLHCITSDIHREGTMKDYFPSRG
jgi:hypothetical protein